ncbi:dTMP kinase [Stygiolobus caldivivus]|uniref:dTMP kinase n=1 Tax=Stygiolobus caldivivus TaxID=2824673 RepID=UPI001C84C19C|nr:dTMP kinase [Stygiolobus caldivivus]
MRIISFEGIDGSGKTTVSKLVYEKIRNVSKRIILTKEPYTEEISSLIEKAGWKDPVTLTLLFAADRAYHLQYLSTQNPDLVIMDRYIYSSVAYQSALGLDENWIELVNSKFPKPFLTILLDLSPEIAIRRIQKNDKFNFQEKLDSLKLVRERYLEIAKKEKNIVIINAEEPLDKVVNKVYSVIYSYLSDL